MILKGLSEMTLDFIPKATRKIIRILNRNSPTILTGLSAAGFITTVILAVKATPKALELIEEEHKIRKKETNPELYYVPILTPWETIELTWKCYIPTTAMGLASLACLIGANSINLRRNAALASLYSITDTALKEYQAKVVERIGKTKEENIRGEIAQDKLNNNPVSNSTVIITGKGDMLCFESLSGRYFKNDIEKLRRIQNDFNKRLLNEIDLPINELYYEMGLSPIKIGDTIGWTSLNRMLEFKFNAKIADDGQPCIVVDYEQLPTQIRP